MPTGVTTQPAWRRRSPCPASRRLTNWFTPLRPAPPCGLNAHYLVTPAALLFIYLRRNDSFYFVRNMFIVAMAIALVGYAAFPTAPPRLMPEWGFTDSISQFLHAPMSIDDGPAKLFVNFYAAVPSMHLCMRRRTISA